MPQFSSPLHFWRSSVASSHSITFQKWWVLLINLFSNSNVRILQEFYKFYVNKAAKARQPDGTDILHEAQDVEGGESEQLTQNTHPSFATYYSVLKEVPKIHIKLFKFIFDFLVLAVTFQYLDHFLRHFGNFPEHSSGNPALPDRPRIWFIHIWWKQQSRRFILN